MSTMELPATQARGRLTSLGAAIGGLRRRTWTGPGTTHPLLMCWAAATVGLLFVLRLRSTAPPQPSMTQIRVPPRVGNAPAYMTLRPVGGGGLTDSEIRMRRIGPRDDPNVLEGAAVRKSYPCLTPCRPAFFWVHFWFHFGRFSRGSKPYATPPAPCGLLYFALVRIAGADWC